VPGDGEQPVGGTAILYPVPGKVSLIRGYFNINPEEMRCSFK
jgi:hypothetical protein